MSMIFKNALYTCMNVSTNKFKMILLKTSLTMLAVLSWAW